MEMVVISYLPLVYTRSIPNETDKLVKFIEDSHDGRAQGCMWLKNEDQYGLVLIYDDAKEIADHILSWSEGEIEKWFTLNYHNDNSGYKLALYPDINRSIERTCINKQLELGYPIPKDTKFNVVFKPLNFMSEQSRYNLSQETIKVYLLDTKHAKSSSSPEEFMEQVILLGNFKLENRPEMLMM